MLELTNLRHGAVVNAADGVESEHGLTLQVEGLAEPGALVQVNDVRADLVGRLFRAPVTLTRQFNDIVVTSRDKHGDSERRIRVVWDRQSFRRYNYFIDDNSFFLTDIAKQGCGSLFDHFYLGFLRRMHQEYGTKFTLNLFYHNDHHDFTITDFPDRYKGEWQDNADWLKLSFHAHSEFPDPFPIPMGGLATRRPHTGRGVRFAGGCVLPARGDPLGDGPPAGAARAGRTRREGPDRRVHR